MAIRLSDSIVGRVVQRESGVRHVFCKELSQYQAQDPRADEPRDKRPNVPLPVVRSHHVVRAPR